MIKAVGYRILVKPDYEKATKSGLLIIEEDRSGIAAVTTGIVISVGPDAWREFSEPWAKVGDRILYGKYGGRVVKDPDSQKKYIVLNDQDVIMTIEGDKSDYGTDPDC